MNFFKRLYSLFQPSHYYTMPVTINGVRVGTLHTNINDDESKWYNGSQAKIVLVPKRILNLVIEEK